MKYKKGRLHAKGKTKEIRRVKDSSTLGIVKNFPAITKFDNPKFTQRFGNKGVCCTITTSRIFELLKKADIPVAYREQISDTEFVTEIVRMIMLEAVIRRLGVGSLLKRDPTLKRPAGMPPYRFPILKTEFFLKTSGGKLVNSRGKVLVKGLDVEAGEEDPLILNPYDSLWALYRSKKPEWDPEAFLQKSVLMKDVIYSRGLERMKEMRELLIKVFLVIEGAFANFGYHFVDLKIEFGLTRSGRLVVADVVDNDSWRVMDPEWVEMSKESFRQGESMNEVARKYGVITSLVEQFRIPKQALVLWRGSSKDDFPELPKDELRAMNISVITHTSSGHKQTSTTLKYLNELLANYPDGGVIIATVGRSNGLGPTLAAHTCWPVISIPATMKTAPHDLWSSVSMPSDDPHLTAWPADNAVLAAMNILSQKNPILYMKRQSHIETLDQDWQ